MSSVGNRSEKRRWYLLVGVPHEEVIFQKEPSIFVLLRQVTILVFGIRRKKVSPNFVGIVNGLLQKSHPLIGLLCKKKKFQIFRKRMGGKTKKRNGVEILSEGAMSV
jgi:hypothetical protein